MSKMGTLTIMYETDSTKTDSKTEFNGGYANEVLAYADTFNHHYSMVDMQYGNYII